MDLQNDLNAPMNGLTIMYSDGNLYSAVDSSSTITTTATNETTGWQWWTNQYYPQVITQSYPVYFQERAQDKGKQAFEIIKALMDKKLITLPKVKDFVDAMDTLIKIL